MAARRSSKRTRRRRGRFGFLYKALSLVLILAAIVAGCIVFFRVNDVAVSGESKYTAQEIIDVTGVQQGDNLLLLPRNQIVKRILTQLPYVSNVNLRLSLPDTLLISVTECAPAALVQGGEGWWIIDARGKLLEQVSAPTVRPDLAKVTGVTALLPHPGDIFHDKVMAASHVINGFGKTTGLVQIEELGTLETPILFTNTLSVGTVETALVKYMLDRNPDICETTGSVNPVVCECNDSGLNDIRGLHVTEENVWAALADCRADFAEGAVGAGRGMRCHGLKGGIGSSSRIVAFDGCDYTIGVLVLTNFGSRSCLRIAGRPVGRLLAEAEDKVDDDPDKGSIVAVIATDLPADSRQLRRMAKRVTVGIARCGGYIGNGSGEIVVAFSTANRIPHWAGESRGGAAAPVRPTTTVRSSTGFAGV